MTQLVGPSQQATFVYVRRTDDYIHSWYIYRSAVEVASGNCNDFSCVWTRILDIEREPAVPFRYLRRPAQIAPDSEPEFSPHVRGTQVRTYGGDDR